MFHDLKHILLLTTGYTGANKAQKVYCGRHQCSRGSQGKLSDFLTKPRTNSLPNSFFTIV